MWSWSPHCIPDGFEESSGVTASSTVTLVFMSCLVYLQYIFDNVQLFCNMPVFHRECPSVPVKQHGSHNSNMNILQIYVTRLYRVHASACSSIHLEPVPVAVESLDPRFVFVLDTGLKIFMWYGKKSKNTLKSKARYNFLEVNWCFFVKYYKVYSV